MKQGFFLLICCKLVLLKIEIKMHQCFVLLGSNIGDRLENLNNATNRIALISSRILSKSSVYKTAAWGITVQQEFYNCVLQIETTFNPELLLQTLLQIEIEMGRSRIQKWEPRIIDIDILYFDESVIESEILKIPHLFLHQRRFTLEPLCEIAPDFVHPVFNKTNAELLRICNDNLSVIKI